MAKTQIRLDTQAQNATLTPDKVSTVATDDFSFPRDVSAGRDLKVTDGNRLVLGNSDNAWIKFDTSYVRIATPVSFEDGVITAQDGANLNINLLGTGIARFDHVSNGGPATGLNLEGNDIFDTNSLSFSLGAQVYPITTGQSTTQVVLNSNSSYFNFADVDFGSSDWDAFNFTPNNPANGIGIVFTEDKATYIGRHNNNLGLFGAPNIFLKGNLTLSAKVLTSDTSLIATNDRENNVILIDASAGDVTITLSLNSNGWWYFFKRIDSSANAVTISAPTDLIDGAASYPLTTQYQCVELLSDYTTWQILGTNGSGGGMSFPILAPDGSDPAPSYSFASDSGTGMRLGSVGQLSFGTEGVQRVTISADELNVQCSQILMVNGDESTPAYSFDADSDTGFYRVTTNIAGLTAGGTQTWQFASTYTEAYVDLLVNNGANLKVQNAGYLQLQDTAVIRNTDGDEINPSYMFDAHSGWGMYYDNGFSAIGMSTGSGKALTLDNNGALTLYQGAGGYLLDGLMKLWSDNQAVYLDNQSAGRGGAPLLVIRDSSETIFYNLNDSSLDMVSKPIINVTDPTNPQDAATKAYVDANSSGPATVATVTMASYTAAADHIILADATSNAITVNLPAASGNSGMQYVIKKIDSSANTVTIDGNASETIDGATTYVETTQYESITIVCDGSNWFII